MPTDDVDFVYGSGNLVERLGKSNVKCACAFVLQGEFGGGDVCMHAASLWHAHG